jgi:dsRNA-specific ribonuclease
MMTKTNNLIMECASELRPGQGDRSDDFKIVLRKTLLLAKNLSHARIESILDSKSNMVEFSNAFTAASFDPENNYEYYEQLGDVSVNKFLVWYFYKRFPFLKCTKGVKVIARLKINYCSRQSFYEIAEKLGFWKFISADETEKLSKRKDLLEDSLESFVGVTEHIFDNMYRPGIGFVVVTEILTSIFDGFHISLSYESLYDAKTRLKELYDFERNCNNSSLDLPRSFLHKNRIGNCTFTTTRNEINQMFECIVFDSILGKIGNGCGAKKNVAEQSAATQALSFLNKKNISKDPPEEYKVFRNKSGGY